MKFNKNRMLNDDNEIKIINCIEIKDPLGEYVFIFLLPLRRMMIIYYLQTLSFLLFLFWQHLIDSERGLEPSTIGVPNLAILSIVGIITFLIPWGYRIFKTKPKYFKLRLIFPAQAQ